jgi:hypothetical protein
MAKSTTSVVKPATSALATPTAGLSLPEHLRDKQVTGLSEIKKNVIIPRLKIVQSQSSSDLRNAYGEGTVLVSPTQQVVAKPTDRTVGASFCFVPLFFFVNWATWNDIKLKGTEPAVRYVTCDPTDPIVAKSRNKELRSEPHPSVKDRFIRHVEQLNFVVALQDHDLGDTPIILTFARSEHYTGSKFCSLIRMRKASPFYCVFNATVGQRQNQQGSWYGYDVTNPQGENAQWVMDPNRCEQYAQSAASFEKIFKESGIVADTSDEDHDGDPTVDTSTAGKF